jgi:hypothetical protein
LDALGLALDLALLLKVASTFDSSTI